MLIGNYAVAFFGKRLAPNASLGTLTLAALWPNLVWPIFLLLGIERTTFAPGATRVVPLAFEYIPFSHSLLAVLLWGLLLGSAYWAVRRQRVGAVVVGACVISHWWLSAISHWQDLPLSFQSTKMAGMGLWNTILGTAAVEGLLFFAGIVAYLRGFQARTEFGRYVLLGFVCTLCIAYSLPFFDLLPASPRALAWTTLIGQWLFVAWAYVVDQQFEARISLSDTIIIEEKIAA